MASVDVKDLSATEHDELCCTYAALLLHDGGVGITADKLTKVIKASGNAVEGYWPGLFSKALEGQDIKSLLANVSAGPAAPAGGAAVAEVAADAAPAKKAEKEKEPSEEEVDMGGMFGDEDDDY